MELAETAAQYIGKREKPANSGFIDPDFEKAMRSVGWIPGWSWCALFVRLVMKLSGYDTSWTTPGVVASWRNAKAKGITGQTPRPGAVVCWQHTENATQGHTGIVESVADSAHFTTIEGNTNAAGSINGDRVARKTRTKTERGLKLLGFVYPTKAETVA